MRIDELIQVKNEYIKLMDTNNDKYKYNIFMILLDVGASVRFLEKIQSIFETGYENFLETIQFMFFLEGYHYYSEEAITSMELLTIDVCLFEYDEDDNYINQEYNKIEKFEIYKKKFL